MIRHLIMVMPDQFKTQEMCYEAVRIEPRSLAFAPDCLKTKRFATSQCAENHTH